MQMPQPKLNFATHWLYVAIILYCAKRDIKQGDITNQIVRICERLKRSSFVVRSWLCASASLEALTLYNTDDGNFAKAKRLLAICKTAIVRIIRTKSETNTIFILYIFFIYPLLLCLSYIRK